VRLVFAAAFLLWAGPIAAPLGAQRNGVRLDVKIDTLNAAAAGPTISTANLLADANTRELLRAGFATRVSYRLELWRKGGLFEDLSDHAEWDVYVQYDPTLQIYNVIRRQDRQLESFAGSSTVTTAELQFGGPYRVPLRPNRSGKFYYYLTVEVQPMLESDLDALLQWTRGPTAPGKSSPLNSIRGGVGRLLSRVLGGDKQHYEARTRVFTVP
jgi:hypothetical protein